MKNPKKNTYFLDDELKMRDDVHNCKNKWIKEEKKYELINWNLIYKSSTKYDKVYLMSIKKKWRKKKRKKITKNINYCILLLLLLL